MNIVLPLIASWRADFTGAQVGIKHHQAIVVFAPAFAARDHARQQLALLLVSALFDDATFITMDGKAGYAARDQHAAVQNHFVLRIVQHHVRPVVDFRAFTQGGDIPLHRLRQAEQLQRLVDQMWT